MSNYVRGELKEDHWFEPFRATIMLVEFTPKVILLRCKNDQGELIEVASFDVDGPRRFYGGDIIEGYLPCYKRNNGTKRYMMDGYTASTNPESYVYVAEPHKKDELYEIKKHVVELVKSYDNLEALYQIRQQIIDEKLQQEDDGFVYEDDIETEDHYTDLDREAMDIPDFETWGD